jgi:hypothetical protein
MANSEMRRAMMHRGRSEEDVVRMMWSTYSSKYAIYTPSLKMKREASDFATVKPCLQTVADVGCGIRGG